MYESAMSLNLVRPLRSDYSNCCSVPKSLTRSAPFCNPYVQMFLCDLEMLATSMPCENCLPSGNEGVGNGYASRLMPSLERGFLYTIHLIRCFGEHCVGVTQEQLLAVPRVEPREGSLWTLIRSQCCIVCLCDVTASRSCCRSWVSDLCD